MTVRKTSGKHRHTTEYKERNTLHISKYSEVKLLDADQNQMVLPNSKLGT